jgi:hypothetical protein
VPITKTDVIEDSTGECIQMVNRSISPNWVPPVELTRNRDVNDMEVARNNASTRYPPAQHGRQEQVEQSVEHAHTRPQQDLVSVDVGEVLQSPVVEPTSRRARLTGKSDSKAQIAHITEEHGKQGKYPIAASFTGSLLTLSCRYYPVDG